MNLQEAAHLHFAGKPEEAEPIYRQTLVDDPHNADALHLLGLCHSGRKEYDQAITLMRRAIRIKADPIYHSNLGEALRNAKRLDEASIEYARAIQINPNIADIWSNLGNVLSDQENWVDSEKAIKNALLIDPRHANALYNLGSVYHQTARFEEAKQQYRKALEITPDAANIHWNLSLCLLVLGEFEEGWNEYEWRWKLDMFKKDSMRVFESPAWNGEDLNGKTILVCAEQGFGDTIMMVRYVSVLEGMGAKVRIEIQPGLQRMLEKRLLHDETRPTHGKEDYHCFVMSLPRFIKDVPSTPYIKSFRDSGLNGTPLIGVCWAGNPTHGRDKWRSMGLGDIKCLWKRYGGRGRFVNLQRDKDGKTVDVGMWAPFIGGPFRLDDFEDTAKLIDDLDVLITVDTAIAHLAGAMGKPVYLMLPFVPDFRWGLDTTTTHWYPSMRLFRQKAHGQWGSVVEEVMLELNKEFG